MINVAVVEAGGKPYRITVDGHAEKEGLDGYRACAAVSVLCMTLHSLTSDMCQSKLGSGTLVGGSDCKIDPGIAETIVHGFELLSQAYPEHVTYRVTRL